MAQEHLNNLVTSLGLEATDIETILAVPEGDAAFKADEYVSKVDTSISTKIKNDAKFWESLDENNISPEFKKKIEAQQYGRAANITRQKVLKGFGFTEEDFSDLPDEQKTKLELFIGIATEKYANTKAGDKQLQQQLVEARKKFEELELQTKDLPTQLKEKYQEEFNTKSLDFIFLAELASIPNLKAPANFLVGALGNELKNEFAFVVDGIKALPKQKSNTNLDVLDGTKVLTLKDLMIQKLKANNLMEEGEGGGGKQKGTTKVDVDPDGKGNVEVSSYIMDKIKANQ